MIPTFAVLTAVGCSSSSSTDDSAEADGGDEGGALGQGGNGGSGDNGTGGKGGTGSAPGSDGGAADASVDGSSFVNPGTCGTANPQTGFIAKVTVMVGATARTLALTVPAGYNGTKVYPLVIGFHGDGGNGAGYRTSLPIEAAANGNAIFAWPDGTNNNNGHSFDQSNDPPNNKDVDFFEAIISSLTKTYCIDKKKVFIHGMSGGAYFVNQLARWKAPEIRGAAPQSGGGPYGINGSDYNAMGNLSVNGAVPVFIVHGNADTSVPLTEGQKSYTYWQGADQTKTGTAAVSPSPCVKQNGGVVPVEWCVIPGMGHTIWPGAAAGIWAFFAAL